MHCWFYEIRIKHWIYIFGDHIKVLFQQSVCLCSNATAHYGVNCYQKIALKFKEHIIYFSFFMKLHVTCTIFAKIYWRKPAYLYIHKIKWIKKKNHSVMFLIRSTILIQPWPICILYSHILKNMYLLICHTRFRKNAINIALKSNPTYKPWWKMHLIVIHIVKPFKL